MDTAALFEQALKHHQAGRLQEAAETYQELLNSDPAHAGGLCNLGMLLCQAGYPESGLPLFEHLQALHPNNHEYCMYLGNAQYMMERYDAAEASYRAALALCRNDAAILFNLGNALKGQGKHEEAVSCYQQALAQRPAYREAFINMGLCFYELGRVHAAANSFRHALEIEPADSTTHHNLGQVLRSMGQLDAAKQSYLRALQIRPDYVDAHDSLLFLYNLMAEISPDEMLQQARRYGELVQSQAKPYQSWQVSSAPQKRLRVGLVSGDFCGHPVGFFLGNVVNNLDPQRLELVAYATDTHEDWITARLRPRFTSWVNASALGDEELARRIHDDGIDILIDLAGHTRNNRLPVFAWRPAPVQATWLGYLATTGVPGMDYLLADQWCLPAEEEHQFTESIWRLPDTYLCFTPPDLSIEPGPLPALHASHFTFGCFNNIAKLNDAVVALWSRILHAVPHSRLFLKTAELGDDEQMQFVRQRFASHGIGTERLVLEGRSPSLEEHFRAFQRVDLALDPFPYPGITSTMDALWMGVPVLSLKGDRLLGHQGETLLRNAGLEGWNAADADEYAGKAVAFACDLESLSRLRDGLRAQVLSSPLCDAGRFARNFENALSEMWRKRCQTLATPQD